MARISFIVIECSDIEASKHFYESLFDIHFNHEKHDDGPWHYAVVLDGWVLELYSRQQHKSSNKSTLRLGIVKSGERFGFTATDPDGNKVIIQKGILNEAI